MLVKQGIKYKSTMMWNSFWRIIPIFFWFFTLNGDLCLQSLYLFQKIKLFIQEEFHPIVLDRQAKSEGGLYTKFSLYWSKKLRSRYSSIVKKVKGKFGLVKVRQSRNGFFKPTILPKQYYKRIRLFVFRRIRGHQKSFRN